jgi:hypothetical protein
MFEAHSSRKLQIDWQASPGETSLALGIKVTKIQTLGAAIETARFTQLYAYDLQNDINNVTVVDLAGEEIETSIAILVTLHSNDPADWEVKARVLMMCGDRHLDPELSSLAMSLAQDIAFSAINNHQ